MSRRSDEVTIVFQCSRAEAELLDQMRGTTATRPNIVRVALWSLADHMGIDPAPGVFDLRDKERATRGPRKYISKRKANPRISQHAKPSQDHPWRMAFTATGGAR